MVEENRNSVGRKPRAFDTGFSCNSIKTIMSEPPAMVERYTQYCLGSKQLKNPTFLLPKDEQQEKYTCYRCYKISQPPVYQFLACSHRLCYWCSFNKDSVCNCSVNKSTEIQNSNQVFLDSRFSDQILDLTCLCPNFDRGCKLEISYKQLRTHLLNNCNFSSPNGNAPNISTSNSSFLQQKGLVCDENFDERLEQLEKLVKNNQTNLFKLKSYFQDEWRNTLHARTGYSRLRKLVILRIQLEERLRNFELSQNNIADSGNDHFYIFRLDIEDFKIQEDFELLKKEVLQHSFSCIRLNTEPVYIPKFGYKVFLMARMYGSTKHDYTLSFHIALLLGNYDAILTKRFCYRVTITLMGLEGQHEKDKKASFIANIPLVKENPSHPLVFEDHCLKLTKSDLEANMDKDKFYLKLEIDMNNHPEFYNAIPASQVMHDA